MYPRLLSGAVESMNRANSKMRARTAVDLPNATILLLKLECTRFNKMKQEALGRNSILTPRGKDEYDATFTTLNPSHSIFHLRDKDDHWQLRVFRQNVPGRNEQIVKLPKNLVNGLYFGRYLWSGPDRCSAMRAHGRCCAFISNTSPDNSNEYYADMVEA